MSALSKTQCYMPPKFVCSNVQNSKYQKLYISEATLYIYIQLLWIIKSFFLMSMKEMTSKQKVFYKEFYGGATVVFGVSK